MYIIYILLCTHGDTVIPNWGIHPTHRWMNWWSNHYLIATWMCSCSSDWSQPGDLWSPLEKSNIAWFGNQLTGVCNRWHHIRHVLFKVLNSSRGPKIGWNGHLQEPPTKILGRNPWVFLDKLLLNSSLRPIPYRDMARCAHLGLYDYGHHCHQAPQLKDVVHVYVHVYVYVIVYGPIMANRGKEDLHSGSNPIGDV